MTFEDTELSGRARILQDIRDMRGRSRGRLMRAGDGEFYVVKFQGNPQGSRTLVNDYVGAVIGIEIGLPMATPALVEIEKCVAAAVSRLPGAIGVAAGVHFGTRYVRGPVHGQVFDYMPESMLDSAHVRNLDVLLGALLLDEWLANADDRQVVYCRTDRSAYSITLIDQGACFGGTSWSFTGSAATGAFANNLPYRSVTGWRSFDLWMDRIRDLQSGLLDGLLDAVPEAWYGSDRNALQALLEKVDARRFLLPDLVLRFKDSQRNPFPNWR